MGVEERGRGVDRSRGKGERSRWERRKGVDEREQEGEE